MDEQYESMMFAAGYVQDPVLYAIEALKYVDNLIGQDKFVTFALMGLIEYQKIRKGEKECQRNQNYQRQSS